MRPIDADEVMEEINRIGGHNLCEWDTLGVKALIDRQTTTDVVPREEVERIKREIFEEIEKHILENCCLTEDDVDGIWKHIAELKKKYMEEETDGKRTDR